MKDRQPTQVLDNGAIRYGIYNADGSLDHYEYLKREDAPTVEGTPLNKANLLSDATAAKIWPSAATRPEDPTVSEALMQLKLSNAKIGDILMTARNSPSDKWLECNGQLISAEQYPQLCSVLRGAAAPNLWTISAVSNQQGAGDDVVSYANGYWFRSYSNGTTRRLMVSSNLASWSEWDISAFADTFIPGHVHYYDNVYAVLAGKNIYLANELFGNWTTRVVEPGPGGASRTQDWPNYDGDMYYDGTYYIVPSGLAGAYYTDNLRTGTWSHISGKTQKYQYPVAYSHAWDPVHKILYTLQEEYSDSSSGSVNPDVLSAIKNVATGSGTAVKLPTIASCSLQQAICWANDSLIMFYKNTGTLKPVLGIYNPDTNSVQQVPGPSDVSSDIYDMRIAYIAGNYIITTLNKTTLYMTSDLITPTWSTVELQAAVGGRQIYTLQYVNVGAADVRSGYTADDSTNKIIIALASKNAIPCVAIHDFTYDNKYLPNITPSANTKAYIKAMEE